MKYSTSTYLRGIDNYKLYLYKNNKEIITIKKVLNILEPFSLIEFDRKVKLIDNNYYIVDILPINSFYICRLFLDDKFNVIEEYYSVTKDNKISDGIGTYDDLSLSYVKIGNKRKIYHGELQKENNNYLNDSIIKIKKLNINIKEIINIIKKVVNF